MPDPIETPSDLLRREEIELPDFIGIGGYHYRDCVLVYIVRVWQYLRENTESIDADGYDSAAAFESDHREALLRRADGLGLSTVQASSAQAAALLIHQRGFETWRTQQFERRDRTFVWRPTDEFEVTERKYAEDIIDAFDEEHPFYDAAMETLDGVNATNSSQSSHD
jgi:hypothetical protein